MKGEFKINRQDWGMTYGKGMVDDEVTILMPGGELSVRRDGAGHLVQSGPARRVYRATVDLSDFA